jgi:uncharacterized protein YbgA (DUF1722 family)/uncharacterized protein YbbK (DUF523 family)
VTAPSTQNNKQIRIAISSCLLGEEVRYDGGHKHNSYITKTLGQYFDYVPFCPETAIGLGVPRPPIRLVRMGTDIRAKGVDNPQHDVTNELSYYGKTVAKQLKDMSGYIFKKGSPSCGMERVKVYHENGHPVDSSAGIFSETIMSLLPELPVEEEGRLMDPVLRENFIERVFVYANWQRYCQKGLTANALVDFHTRYKFTVLAHDEPGYRQLGRLVADAGKFDLQDLGRLYIAELMKTLKVRATPKKHANVLMHIMGFLKNHLSNADKNELLELIGAYRNNLVPLIVPITLLQHYLRLYPDDYISNQAYLNPHPKELMLRNHI